MRALWLFFWVRRGMGFKVIFLTCSIVVRSVGLLSERKSWLGRDTAAAGYKLPLSTLGHIVGIPRPLT